MGGNARYSSIFGIWSTFGNLYFIWSYCLWWRRLTAWVTFYLLLFTRPGRPESPRLPRTFRRVPGGGIPRRAVMRAAIGPALSRGWSPPRCHPHDSPLAVVPLGWQSDKLSLGKRSGEWVGVLGVTWNNGRSLEIFISRNKTFILRYFWSYLRDYLFAIERKVRWNLYFL